jgi:methylmalonyl-CoA/ethylmalonyl-CoA epimerase
VEHLEIAAAHAGEEPPAPDLSVACRSMSVQLGPLRQVGQGARDLDRAIAFYRDVLGLRLLARFGNLAFFDLDGVRLFLEQGDEGGGSTLYLSVPDIREARRQLEDRGVTFEDDPHVIFADTEGTFGTAGEEEWMTFFRDSEGNLLALSSRELPKQHTSS